MKKIFAVIAAVLIAAVWVMPTQAETTFYGTYRVRMFNTNNASDYSDKGAKTYTGVGSATTTSNDVTDANSWTDQRFRLGVESKASEQLRGFVQLQIGNSSGPNRSNIWGDGSYTSAAIFARQAYLSFNVDSVLRLKAGRQIFGDSSDGGQAFKVSDDNVYYGLIDGGLVLVSQLDAFILTTQKSLDPVTLYFGYAKLTETSASSTTTGASDADRDLYILQAIATPSDSMKTGAYFLYERDRTTISTTTGIGQDSPWWLGGGIEAKFNPISLKVHAAYKGGKLEKGCQPSSCGIAATGSATNLKYSAYAIDSDISVNVGVATIGVVTGMGTGDKSATDTKSKAFNAVAGAYGVQLGVRPAIFFDNGEISNGGSTLSSTGANTGGGFDNTTLGNITFAELYASFKVTDDLDISSLVASFWNTEKKRETSSTNTNTWESKLGSEIDVNAIYKIYPQLALVTQAAWFFPGDGILTYTNTAGANASGTFATDDKVSEYFAKIQYDF